MLIALDGGGTKTDGVALDRDGRLLATVRLPASSAHHQNFGRTLEVVDAVVARLRADTGDRTIAQCNIYLSGLDFPEEIEAFRTELAARAWARGPSGPKVVVGNDLFALLRSGTAELDAIAVVCGTGINCVGVRRDGKLARFPAIGMISGDWGGGYGLGQAALWHAARAMDGRGDSTVLMELLPRHFGLDDMSAVIAAFHFGRLSHDIIPELTRILFRASDAGDAVAGAIVDRQADEIVAMAVAALARLELLSEAVPVVMGGGVLAAGNERLVDGVCVRLAERAPKAVIRLVRSRPILGAALLTLESAGASPKALATVREALEPGV